MGTHQRIGKSNEWYTPAYIFDALGETFDLDVAAPPEGPRHVPARQWFWRDSLSQDWRGFVWMNPPFGGRNGLQPWLEKFVQHPEGIALVPDRTSAPWFPPAARRCDAMLLIAPKIKFERPDGTRGEQPGDGTALLARGERAEIALRRASRLGTFWRQGAPVIVDTTAIRSQT